MRLRTGLRKQPRSTWKDLLTLPARAARFAVVDAPFSSRLEVTGVSLALVAHNDRQPGVPFRAAVPQSPTRNSAPDRPPQTPPPSTSVVSSTCTCFHAPMRACVAAVLCNAMQHEHVQSRAGAPVGWTSCQSPLLQTGHGTLSRICG